MSGGRSVGQPGGQYQEVYYDGERGKGGGVQRELATGRDIRSLWKGSLLTCGDGRENCEKVLR